MARMRESVRKRHTVGKPVVIRCFRDDAVVTHTLLKPD
jgi:hypothetical protein